MWYLEKNIPNKGCNLLNPYFWTVLLSIPFNNLPSSALYNNTAHIRSYPGKIRQEYKDQYVAKMTPSHNGAMKVFNKTDETGKVIHPKY